MESKKSEVAEYLTSKMYNFLEPMLVEVMKNKPSNTVEFCINWLQKFEGKRLNNSEDRKNGNDSDEDDDIVDDKLIEKKRLQQRNSKKRSRMGISEEVFGCFNKKSRFEPKKIEKSEESRILILSLIRNCILFQSTSNADEELIINAMGERECCLDESIIEEGQDGDELYIVGSGEYDCFKNINGKIM